MGGFPAGRVGDDAHRLAAARAGLQAGALAYDPGDLCGVREVEAIDGQDLHHAGLLSAVLLGAVVELLD